MERSDFPRAIGLMIAGAAACVLALLTAGVVASSAEPTRAGADERIAGNPALVAQGGDSALAEAAIEEQKPITPTWELRTRPDRAIRLAGVDDRPFASGDVTISKRATTGVLSDTVVYNGDAITYTLTITNHGDSAVEGIVMYDTLPDGLYEVACDPACYTVDELIWLRDPFGSLYLVTATVEITWSIPSLPPGSDERVFSARVLGQPDGTVIKNAADLEYGSDIAVSNETETMVRVRVVDDGRPVVSDAPTWLSSDLGGTLSLDWGDVNRDGYLDLALGSTAGTTVYRYVAETGRLARFWGNEYLTLGVRWADLDGDGLLELVAVGNSLDRTAVSEGTNYVWSFTGSEPISKTFRSDYQLLRVEPGDYDDDGDIDLIASINAITATCTVGLLWNDGTGTFSNSFPGPGDPNCVSTDPAASLASGDYDNDGDLDLALGQFLNLTHLVTASASSPHTNPFAGTNPVVVDISTAFLPYDLAWGDYDRDGYLDLAAAFPLDRKVRIYHNQGGTQLSFAPDLEIPTRSFRTPLAVDWADFNGDGLLDLVVADRPLMVHYLSHGRPPTWTQSIAVGGVKGQIWATAAADLDSDGDLDLALGNRDGASLLFTTFAPFLDTQLMDIGTWQASSVAWGDVVGDGYLDLLFGSGEDRYSSAQVWLNQGGSFQQPLTLEDSRWGPHGIALGDADADYRLDVLLGASRPTAERNRLYLATEKADPWPPSGWWNPPAGDALPSYAVAWGDADNDGDLDLLVGNNGPNRLYLNTGTSLSSNPIWASAESDPTRSVAWGDLDGDRYLDVAVGNWGQPNRIYHNAGDTMFHNVWSAVDVYSTTSVAWADYDADGDMDLAVGNYGQANLLYQNVAGTLTQSPIWHSRELSRTTSLAWGDWDNDGDLDLAVGNDGEPDQVYTNQGSAPGSPRLLWVWTSEERQHTTGVAWGDRDGDGDLDLAISQGGSGQNGFYENNYVLAFHLTTQSGPALPLPNNPPYLTIKRPGSTQDAYYFSSGELLAYPSPITLTVPVSIHFTLYDPEGRRAAVRGHSAPTSGPTPIPGYGGSIATERYEFSLDGGGTWKEAQGAAISATGTLTRDATFLWKAREDRAISDDARFRITLVHQNPVGPVQRASTSALSPPFRIRATTCVWPAGPSFMVNPDPPEPREEVTFEGAVVDGSGVLTYTWDFGDGTPQQQGQMVRHAYARAGNYSVRMLVSSQPCPMAGVVTETRTLMVGGGHIICLPLVMKQASWVGATRLASAVPLPASDVDTGTNVLQQVDTQRPLETENQPQAGGFPMPTHTTVGSVDSTNSFPPGVITRTRTTSMPITLHEGGVHGQPSINGNGTRIAFWSAADLAPSGCITKPLAAIGPILLVDDDDNSPDVRTSYTAALDDLGLDYSVWDTNNSDYEPHAASLAPYAGVLWFTGHEWGGHAGPGAGSEATLASFLEGGKFLLISSQDYLWDRGLTPFMQQYLGVGSYTHDVGHTQVTGVGSVFGGLGPYALTYGFTNYSDRIAPDPGAEVAFQGNGGEAAVHKATRSYRTTFLGFPFEALPSDDRPEAMRTALKWLGCASERANPDGNVEVFLAEVSSNTQPPTPTFEEVTFSTGSMVGGFNLWPSFSADGSRVAFFSDADLDVDRDNSDANFEIFVYDTSTEVITQVTTTRAGANLWPSISGDGRGIAFVSDQDLDESADNSDGNFEVFVYDAIFDDIIQFTDTETGFHDQPSISGDGAHIAYVYYDDEGNSEIHWDGVPIAVGGTNLQPAIDWHGTYVAFTSNGEWDDSADNSDHNLEIFVYDSTADGFTQLTSTTAVINDQPSINNDGSRVAFVSGSEIWLYEGGAPGAGKAFLLSRAGDRTSRPSISADGSVVVFAAGHHIYQTLPVYTGFKWEDLNADGVSQSEMGMNGWTICATDGVDTWCDTTDDDDLDRPGYYELSLPPGTYTIRETCPADWVQSWPTPTLGCGSGTYTVPVQLGGPPRTGYDFGNWRYSIQPGVKFEDLNADGVKDAGEPGLEDWKIYVDYNGNGWWDADEPWDLTDGDGSYTIEGIRPGMYDVREVGLADWFCSYPDPCYYSETFTSGSNPGPDDYGNWTYATVSGMKCHDENENGKCGSQEPRLQDWDIVLLDATTGVVVTATTDANGYYTFTQVIPGTTYTVCEVLKSGWVQTFPEEDDAGATGCPGGNYALVGYAVTLQSGDHETGKDFGNSQDVTVSGRKWHDQDGDGVMEPGEPGIENWEMCADGICTLTDIDGYYELSLPPGTYTLTETHQVDWTCSHPAPCQYNLTLAAGDPPSMGNDFGNYQHASVSGSKWHDQNGDGLWDDGEPGIESWAMTLQGTDGVGSPITRTTQTDSSGFYSFTVPPGVYTVTEVLQAGWVCSYPNPCQYDNIALTSEGNVPDNDFGNYLSTLVPPAGVVINGPTTGLVGESYLFTATVSPMSTTVPLTYTWEASGQAPVAGTDGLSDTITFSWSAPGTQAITVTASNPAAAVSDTYLISVTSPSPPTATLTPVPLLLAPATPLPTTTAKSATPVSTPEPPPRPAFILVIQPFLTGGVCPRDLMAAASNTLPWNLTGNRLATAANPIVQGSVATTPVKMMLAASQLRTISETALRPVGSGIYLPLKLRATDG